MSHNLHCKKQIAQLADKLSKSSHFTKCEIEAQLQNFRKLTGQKAKMERVTFRDVLHNSFGITEDLFMDRVFKVFDTDNDSFISMEEWINGMSVFLRGTLHQRIKYCFDVYDLNNDGYITREEMFQMMKPCLTKSQHDEDPDEGIKDLVELVLKKIDIDHDSRVSEKDFTIAVEEENLMLQSLGPCIPSQKDIDAFLADISPQEDSIY